MAAAAIQFLVSPLPAAYATLHPGYTEHHLGEMGWKVRRGGQRILPWHLVKERRHPTGVSSTNRIQDRLIEAFIEVRVGHNGVCHKPPEPTMATVRSSGISSITRRTAFPRS